MFRSNVEVGPRDNTVVGINGFLKQMYAWLFGSLIIAGISSFIGMQTALVRNPIAMLVLAVVGFVPLIWTSHEALKNPTLGAVGLIVFSVIDGMSLSGLLALYSGYSITEAFICASAVFGGMSVIGYTTHKDLSHLGTQLFGALIGLIIASIVSIFFANTLVDILINVAGIIIFSGLSIYDTHEAVASYSDYADEASSKGLAIFWALSLYLDFENLFLDILELIGDANNNN